jgi:hypothetical protein
VRIAIKGGDCRARWPPLKNSSMPIDAARFARRWEVNTHDLNELLGHFSDDSDLILRSSRRSLTRAPGRISHRTSKRPLTVTDQRC